MSKPNEPNEPTDPNKQTIESVSFPQIPIPSTFDSPSQLPSAASSSSSSHPAGSSFISSNSLPSLHPLPPPPPLSLAYLEVVLASESHSHSSTNEKNPNNSEAPHPEVIQDTLTPQTPHQSALPLSLTIPLLAFTAHKSSTPLLDCGTITFTPKELTDASYDFLVAKVIVSIEKVLLSQKYEAQKHVEWVEWMEEIEDRGEGSMGDGIGECEIDDIGSIGSEDTVTHGPLGKLGSGVGGVGLGFALRREKLSNFRGGALEIFGRNKSNGLRDRKDRKRRWEFRIYEDPVDREPGRSETAEIRQARKILEIELAIGRQPVREHVGENQENEEMGEADDLLAGDERNKEEEQDIEQIRDQEQKTIQTREINLTPLHPSFPTHLQFTEQFIDLYGDSDSDETNSAGIRELLRFLRERGGRDELIVEYVIL
ncbi:hypothetical protein BPAE_0027g00100 [Botrytis paeoniae]|uniref:Uncharacterized protein n=1 Tax=Botrytis paeoniae TaxID=278948 RepID=A0A4Z1G2A3_9HELO|nr:hypothetical protein BPAE_0027g00100 [Botrytis paeoniae]